MLINKIILTIVFALYCFIIANAQTLINNPDVKRTMHWYFGAKAGVDFTSGQAVADTMGQMIGWKGSTTVSDVNGNLLFYTEGRKVWNRNHEIMPNGSTLNSDSPGGSHIEAIPIPGQTNKYYIFSLNTIYVQDSPPFYYTITYAIVDMNLDGGLGDVVEKGIPIVSKVAELFALARKANSNDYYLISKMLFPNSVIQPNYETFKVFQITANGIDTSAYTTSIGGNYSRCGVGQMIFTGDEKMFGYTDNCAQQPIQLFKFNNETGEISHFFTFPWDWYPFESAEYGLAFSQNNRLLYYTTIIRELRLNNATQGYYNYFTRAVYQVELLDFDSENPSVNRTLLDSNSLTDPFGLLTDYGIDSYLAIQKDPYGQMWISISSRSKLSQIQNPEIAGTGCNFIDSSLYLLGRTCSTGLPNYPSHYFYDSTFVVNSNYKFKSPSYTLHPNPHREQFTLSQTEEGYIKSYKIMDVMGRVMLSATFGIGKEASINTSNLAKGIYILHLETTQGLKAERIVKE